MKEQKKAKMRMLRPQIIVSPDYEPRGNAFSGEVNWVEIDVDKAALDQDHILTAEERFRIALALQ